MVEGKPKPGTPVAAKVKTERKSWIKRNKAREAIQTAYREKLEKPEGIANDS